VRVFPQQQIFSATSKPRRASLFSEDRASCKFNVTGELGYRPEHWTTQVQATSSGVLSPGLHAVATNLEQALLSTISGSNKSWLPSLTIPSPWSAESRRGPHHPPHTEALAVVAGISNGGRPAGELFADRTVPDSRCSPMVFTTNVVSGWDTMKNHFVITP